MTNTKEAVAEILDLSKKLLSQDIEQPSQNEHIEQVMDDLVRVILFHDHQYYLATNPLVTDYEYDQLYKKLKGLEERFPEHVMPDSPTQRVSGGLTKEFPSVRHIVPMLSLDNSYNEADLKEFDRRVKNLTKEEQVAYTIEPKFDGSSISLIYENDKLVRGATRGDGLMGEDITPNVKVLRSVPLRAAFSRYGIHRIEIRGEVLIRKDKFEQINKKRQEQGLPLLANPRNSAAGSLRLQDPKEVAARQLEAVLYHVSYAVDKDGNDLLGEKLKTRCENLKMLDSLGFHTSSQQTLLAKNIGEALAWAEKWEREREDFHYELDGMVLKVDDIELEEMLGSTSHHPRWAIAFKFKARQARTKLLGVQWQVGRVGTITPVAKLEPVEIGGVTVSSAAMFNEDFMRQKDIRIGDYVLVERAGDVIPYIAASLTEARTGGEEQIHYPKHCPSCGADLVRLEEEAAWRCVNTQCPAQQYERLVHFVSKNAMDIGGFGKAIVKDFCDRGWLKSIPDIYNLPFDRILELEGWGERSVEKLQGSIESSKSRDPHRLLFGLGIRYVGETTAKTLMENVRCIEDLMKLSREELEALPDIGPKVGESIFDYFQTEENMALIDQLKRLGLTTCRAAEESNGQAKPLSGKTFLFTGGLTSMSRPEAKERVEALGGKVAGSLSKAVNVLVAGEEAGSKLDKARKMGTVEIVDEEGFLEMLKA